MGKTLSKNTKIIQTPIELENGIIIQFPMETVAVDQEVLDRLTGAIMTLQEIRFNSPNQAFDKNPATNMVFNDD